MFIKIHVKISLPQKGKVEYQISYKNNFMETNSCESEKANRNCQYS